MIPDPKSCLVPPKIGIGLWMSLLDKTDTIQWIQKTFNVLQLSKKLWVWKKSNFKEFQKNTKDAGKVVEKSVILVNIHTNIEDMKDNVT